MCGIRACVSAQSSNPTAEKDYLISDEVNDRLQLCPSLHLGSPCETVFSGFNNPLRVKIVDSGDHLVADCSNDRKQLCPAASPLTACATVGAVGGAGSGATQMNGSQAATVDADGFLIVTDDGNHRVQRCLFVEHANDCTTVAGTETHGSSLTELYHPCHAAIDAAGDYIISDNANHRVVKYPSTSPGSDCTLVVTDLHGPFMVTITEQEST